ncbi:MAG: hypothetical protein ACK5QC_07630 [Bacteroidota bacterium]|jgi:hypothetical protein
MTAEIEDLIKNNFHAEATEFVRSVISKIYENEWGVGKDQLAMSLLKLSNGSVDKLLSYFPIIDPRDIIMETM